LNDQKLILVNETTERKITPRLNYFPGKYILFMFGSNYEIFPEENMLFSKESIYAACQQKLNNLGICQSKAQI